MGAMLGAVGWPLSELFHKQIASIFGLQSILASGDRAPSLLNGGLQSVYASGALMMSIILAGYLEGKAMNDGTIFIGSQKPKDYVPGNLNFDPLNMYSERNALCEIKKRSVGNDCHDCICISRSFYRYTCRTRNTIPVLIHNMLKIKIVYW